MDEVIETLAQMEEEAKQRFIYEVSKSANSNCLQNPLSLAVAATVCKETGVTFIKDVDNVATHHITVLMDMDDRYLPVLMLGKKIAKEATKAIINFVNSEKREYVIRLFDIGIQYDLSNAIVFVDIDYVRDLNNE